MLKAYEMALTTWFEWLDNHVNRSKTRVFFVSSSPTHNRHAKLLIRTISPNFEVNLSDFALFLRRFLFLFFLSFFVFYLG